MGIYHEALKKAEQEARAKQAGRQEGNNTPAPEQDGEEGAAPQKTLHVRRDAIKRRVQEKKKRAEDTAPENRRRPMYAEALAKAGQEEHVRRAGRVNLRGAAGASPATYAISNELHELPKIPPELQGDIDAVQETLEYLHAGTASRVVALCGCSGHDGCSTLAHFLATNYALTSSNLQQRSGRFSAGMVAASPGQLSPGIKSTLLIDANLRAPALHARFNLRKEKGLVEIIEDDLDLDRAVKWILPETLAVLTAGREPSAISDIFKTQRMRTLVQRSGRKFSRVIFDCPAITRHADILPFAEELDGVVLVAASGRTRAEEIQRAHQLLEQKNARVLGIVLNRYREVVPRAIRARL